MFTRFFGWMIAIVLIMAFLPVILEAIGWIIAWIIGGIVILILLGFLRRIILPPRRNGRSHHIHIHR